MPIAEPTINLPNSSTAVDVSHSPTTNTASDMERNASSTVPKKALNINFIIPSVLLIIVMDSINSFLEYI